MRKYFLILLFLCFFLFPKNTFALSFTANEQEYQVVDTESLRDYIYFHYINDLNVSPNHFFTLFSLQSGGTKYYVSIPDNNTYMYDRGNYNPDFIWFGLQNNQTTTPVCTKNIRFDDNFTEIGTGRSCYSPTASAYQNVVLFYHPNIYNDDTFNLNLKTQSNYTYQSIYDKYYNSQVEPEPEPSEEEVNMFDVVSTFLVQFINILPFIIPFILIMNLICRMLFNERG